MKEYKVLACKEHMTIKDEQIKFSNSQSTRIEVHHNFEVVMRFNLNSTILSRIDTKEPIINKLKDDRYNCLVAEIDTLEIIIKNNEDIIKNIYPIIKAYVRNSIGPTLLMDNSVIALLTVNKFTKSLLETNVDKLNSEITIINTDNTDKYLVVLIDNNEIHNKIKDIKAVTKNNNKGKNKCKDKQN